MGTTNIARNFIRLRKWHKLTQEKFAKEMGVTRAKIGSYEEGRAEPSFAFVKAVADKFGVGFETFAIGELPE